MDCDKAQEMMTALMDGEMTDRQTAEAQAHLAQCAECRSECERARAMSPLLGEYERATRVNAPADLWLAVEDRLGTRPSQVRMRFLHPFRRPLALAASLALLIGAGLLFTIAFDRTSPPAQAALVDYSILMEGVTTDVHASIKRFLDHYKAQPVDLTGAHHHAPALSFDVPESLPGGYRRAQVYQLRFGKSPGVAATYEGTGKPLFFFFHPMTDNTAGPSGTTCKVGELHGSEIAVGQWRLLHIMDATTCHCVLTTLDSGPQLESIVRAVAPDLAATIAKPIGRSRSDQR
jgi:hypothetical protein